MTREVKTAEKFARRPLPGLQPAMAHSRPSQQSAPENHDLIWSDQAEDAAKHSTRMAEQPVRRVLHAREAFPVKHEVLRATYADSRWPDGALGAPWSLPRQCQRKYSGRFDICSHA